MKNNLKYNNKLEGKDARFQFAWNVVLAFTIIELLLTITSPYSEPRFFIYYASVFPFLLLALVFLKKSIFNYKIIVNSLFLVIFLVCTLSIFLVKLDIHFQEVFWMLAITIFAFFVSGPKWGISFSVCIALIYVYYYNFLFPQRIHSIELISPKYKDVLAVEYAISLMMIGYAMYQYNSMNRRELKNITETYRELDKEKRAVEAKNNEKTTLLQEIHHRVKNNLQVIVSLLRMQMNELQSDKAKNAFRKSIARVISMALVHQQLYKKASLTKIDIQNYLHDLVKESISDELKAKGFEYLISADFIDFQGRDAIPLGLLVSELVNKSIAKANFNNSNDNYIEIQMLKGKKNRFKMTYLDNILATDNESSSYIFKELIKVFSQQINGIYAYEKTEKGELYQFSFAP